MLEISSLLVVVTVVALVCDFTNGAHDTADAIATVVSTKALLPGIAGMMAAPCRAIVWDLFTWVH